MKFEGKINEKSYTSQEEFNKALTEIQKSGQPYNANYHWEDSNMDSPCESKKELNCKKEQPKMMDNRIFLAENLCPNPKTVLEKALDAYDIGYALNLIRESLNDYYRDVEKNKKSLFQESVLNGNFYNILGEYTDFKQAAFEDKKNALKTRDNLHRELDDLMKVVEEKEKALSNAEKELYKFDTLHSIFDECVHYMRHLEETAINNGSIGMPAPKEEEKAKDLDFDDLMKDLMKLFYGK